MHRSGLFSRNKINMEKPNIYEQAIINSGLAVEGGQNTIDSTSNQDRREKIISIIKRQKCISVSAKKVEKKKRGRPKKIPDEKQAEKPPKKAKRTKTAAENKHFESVQSSNKPTQMAPIQTVSTCPLHTVEQIIPQVNFSVTINESDVNGPQTQRNKNDDQPIVPSTSEVFEVNHDVNFGRQVEMHQQSNDNTNYENAPGTSQNAELPDLSDLNDFLQLNNVTNTTPIYSSVSTDTDSSNPYGIKLYATSDDDLNEGVEDDETESEDQQESKQSASGEPPNNFEIAQEKNKEELTTDKIHPTKTDDVHQQQQEIPTKPMEEGNIQMKTSDVNKTFKQKETILKPYKDEDEPEVVQMLTDTYKSEIRAEERLEDDENRRVRRNLQEIIDLAEQAKRLI